MRLVSTPLTATVAFPAQRPGGIDPRVLEAAVVAPCIPEARERLLAPGTVVVTTGQQPGLFTGPLYTVYKALSAVALARKLESEWQVPVVPVFWLATDDHDFAEAATASWPGADGAVRTVTLRERPPDAGLTPMYRELLGPAITEALGALEGDLQGDFVHETLLWLRKHYRPEATVGGAYAHAMAELLCPWGVVCLDAGSTALKRLAAPWLMKALQASAELNRSLEGRARDLAATGHDADVALSPDATLVMLEGTAGRDRLMRDGDRFRTRRGGETFSLSDLAALAAQLPERLSPNVLLRPVIESALLPTTAYVAGPGELRYLALTPPVYEALDVPRQEPVPRWSGVVVDARAERVLGKFTLELDELLSPPGALESRLARRQLPALLDDGIARLRAALEEEYERLAHGAIEVDPTLEKTVLGARGQALHGLAEVERKLVQHLKRRSETELGQVARARAFVRPDGKPQERVFTVAPFLARYGRIFLEEMLASAAAWYATALEGAGTRS
jgi:bacillithiol biosynthesis cysteine-adding enzyme BshC